LLELEKMWIEQNRGKGINHDAVNGIINGYFKFPCGKLIQDSKLKIQD